MTDFQLLMTIYGIIGIVSGAGILFTSSKEKMLPLMAMFIGVFSLTLAIIN